MNCLSSPKGFDKMIKRYSMFAASIVTLAGATVAHAHPGHGEPGDEHSLWHYVTEPLHLGVGFCMLIGAVVLTRLIRNLYLRGKQPESAV